MFLNVLQGNTAGSPQEENLKWTHLSITQIRDAMLAKNCKVSRHDVNGLLRLFDYKRRKLVKTKCLKEVKGRNDQFEKIELLTTAFKDNGFPILSLDTKNKELIGDFYRSGTYFGRENQQVYDHDFPSYAKGKVVPHGIYDVTDNKGYISLGISHDTSQFVCDNLGYFWTKKLQWNYPDAEWMLLLCDSGGSNNCRHYLFKEDLYHLAQQLQINIVVAHYPTYCSKYNPIERKLFCHLHRQWQGTVLKNIQIVKELAQNTSTTTGLEVDVRINEKQYQTKRIYKPEFKQNIETYVSFDQNSPKWNYTIFYNPL